MPLLLIPYDAARGVEVTPHEIRLMRERGGAWTWVAKRCVDWLQYWLDDIVQKGFYPFDLLAVAYLIDQSAFRCATVHAWVSGDNRLYWPFNTTRALLVDPLFHGSAAPGNVPSTDVVVYCPKAQLDVRQLLIGPKSEPAHCAPKSYRPD